MSMRKTLPTAIFALGLAFSLRAAAADAPKLGKPITEQDVAAWDIAAMPNGDGLPPGSGTAVQGAQVYAQKCSSCHGDGGKGGPVARAPLFGGPPLTSSIDAAKTIGNFWGHATTVFDFTKRSMPFNMPQSLTDNEVYALTAYILALNKIIGENDVMDAKTLPQVKMPNRDGFIIRFPDRI